MILADWFNGSAQSARRRSHERTRPSVRRKFLNLESLENRNLLAGLPPVDISISATSIDENTPANQQVGVFFTDDPDTLADQFTYTLVNGQDSGDNASFSIDGQQLLTSESFDAETKAAYSIRVQTEDPEGNALQKVFLITVNNLNDNLPVFDPNTSSFHVAEGTTAVGNVTATDADSLAALVYSIDPASPDAAQFSVDSNTGTLSFLSAPNFESPADVDGDNVYHVTVEVTDSVHTVQQAVAVVLQNSNEAPILDTSLNPALTIVREEATNPGGTRIASLLTGAVSDPDVGALRGIAITAAANYSGTWQYSFNGSVWTVMGDVSNSAALLLPAWTWVRFVPKENFSGQVGLFYRAWDQTSGGLGDKIDTAVNQGGDKSLSIGLEKATQTVTPLNDAPVLNALLNPVLRTIWEDASSPRGTPVVELVQGAITDIDVAPLRGVAIVGAATNNGAWQYRLSSSAAWQAMGEISEESALLLPVQTGVEVRFVPKPNFNGQVWLYFRAWDRTAGGIGQKVSLLGQYGGSNAFSTDKEGASLKVTAINDKPRVLFASNTGYQRDRPAIVLAPFARLYDIDSPDFDGGQLRVHIDTGASTANRLGIASGFTIDANNDVLRAGVIIGTLNANGGNGIEDLVVSFNADATKAIVQDLLRAITFKTVRGSIGIRHAIFSLTDGNGGMSADVTKIINVT